MQGYDLLAEILCKDGNSEDAEEMIHISVDTKIKTLGQKHPEVAKSLISKSLPHHDLTPFNVQSWVQF